LINIEGDLAATRSNVREAQISQQDLEIKKGEAEAELNDSKEKLSFLAGTIEERRSNW